MTVINADDLTPDTTLTCDICIIGGGAAGITVAHRLLKTAPGKKIILLEGSAVDERQFGADEQLAIVQQQETTSAPESQSMLAAAANPDGHRFVDPEAQRLYAGTQVNPIGRDERFLTRSRIRVYGGTTNCWGGWTRALSPIDFDRSDLNEYYKLKLKVPCKWPITARDLEPHYRSALSYCSLGDFSPSDYDDPQAWIKRTATEIAAAEQKTGAVRTGVFTIMNGDTAGTHYDGALDFQLVWGKDFKEPTNITVVRNANVRTLDSIGDTVRRVWAQTIKRPANGKAEPGLSFYVNASKAYVVAAGGIETARLLLFSKPGGLGNVAGHLGRNFMVHPLNEHAEWVTPKNVPSKIFNFYTGWPKLSSNSIWPPRIFAAFVPTDAAMRQMHIGNYRVLVNFQTGGMNLNWEQMPNPDSQITLARRAIPSSGIPQRGSTFR